MFIAVDIGGTKTEVALGDKKARVSRTKIIPTKPDFNSFLVSLFSIIADFSRNKKIKGISIAAPGPLDPQSGTIFSSPNLRWKNVCIKKILEEKFNLPVVLENDANLAGLGESIYGAGKDVGSLFYLTVSTGIGGGFILDKEIYQGASFDAAEIGHTVVLPDGPLCNCGKRGCLEALCSGRAIAKKARQAVRKHPHSLILRLAGRKREAITAQIVVEALRQNDKLAQQIWQEVCYFLGIGIANMINLVNPEMVVIGGGVSKAGTLLFKPLRKIVREMGWERAVNSCRIVRAKLKNSGIVGALIYASKCKN
ncbi:MAG: ROK family protein [Candidatus Omnitrophica bacterium]|nr:ROK family protein [Candidatus Omnitrophota bacterium]